MQEKIGQKTAIQKAVLSLHVMTFSLCENTVQSGKHYQKCHKYDTYEYPKVEKLYLYFRLPQAKQLY
jgi:hypothetical protein